MKEILKIKKLANADDLPLPSYESDFAAGMDLRAAIGKEPISLKPGERHLIPTGLKLEIPLGFEAQIRPRSGLAYKNGISMVNSPGTIDSDYRGEVKVILINHGAETFVVNHGERIAQMVIAPVSQVRVVEVDEVEGTERGSGGFGSTGVS